MSSHLPKNCSSRPLLQRVVAVAFLWYHCVDTASAFVPLSPWRCSTISSPSRSFTATRAAESRSSVRLFVAKSPLEKEYAKNDASAANSVEKTSNADKRGVARPSKGRGEENQDADDDDDDDDNADADTTPTKLRRLKDRMWVRETLEDLTAAEFASSIDTPGTKGDKGGRGKKRAVDFENILSKLERRLEEMCVLSTVDDSSESDWACYPLDYDASSETCYALVPGEGMGSVVYTDDQRDALLMRVLASRQTLLKVMQGNGADMDPTSAGDLDQIRVQLRGDLVLVDDDDNDDGLDNAKSDPAGKEKRDAQAGAGGTIGDLNVYVRDDGTIDWDGALQDRAALKKFGASVWARINGMDPNDLNGDNEQRSVGDAGGHSANKKVVTVKIAETDAIRKEKLRLDELSEDLKKVRTDHTALLNSAVAAGSAIANVNLASLDPALRAKIRSSSELLLLKEQEVSFQTLKYELERIFTYLDVEMGNTSTKGYIPLQDRLNVAEFGLLESQVESLNRQLEEGESIDADVLAVIMEQLVDFKRRLGIDYYVTGFSFDSEAIQRWLGDLLEKTRDGLGFYVKGCQLFWDDIVYSIRLIGRALQGYTLQPREVRTLRRTLKDVVNFVPFVIILIIPLSPIGHVLVFGAIQRVFPDFFPSCFTERRQNLLNLYESTEYTEVVIDETWQEKITRALEAAAFVVANNARELYKSVGAGKEGQKKDELNGDNN